MRNGGTVSFVVFNFADRPVTVGISLALLTVVVSEFLPPSRALDLHTMILIFISAVYLGFASAEEEYYKLMIEISGIIVFCTLAMLGLWLWPPLLIIGFVGHAAWDVLHHPENHLGAQVVSWYIPLCLSYDLLVAGYLTVTMFVL